MPFTSPNTKLLSDRIATGAGLLVLLAGIATISGWQFRVPILKGEIAGSVIAPNTALCFTLSACALLIGVRRANEPTSRWLTRVLGLLIFVFGSLIVYENFAGADFGIDTIFMAHRLDDWNLNFPPGRFSSFTGTALAATGISLIALHDQRRSIAETFGIIVLLVSVLGITGRAYGISGLYGRWMTPHAAVLFGIMGIGLLFGARRRHLADLLLSDHAGGMLARRLLPATLLAVPMLGWLHLWVQRHTQITLQPSTALFVLTVVFMITAIIVNTARAIDIFDRKRILAEGALRNQEKLAAAGRFAATMAHEINNPLEAVVNLVYLLESDTQLSDRSREYLTLAQQELERVAHITKQTLAFYRESSSPEAVDLAAVAREIISLLKRRIENKGALVRLSEDTSSTILAVKGELRQVLSNILSNALDALPSSGGTIDIRVAEAQGQVTLEITDNGCGIPPEIQGKIFDPFYTTKKEFGTGLGLWVTRQLVEKNRGTIAFQSDRQDKDHCQTSFFVSFPAHAPKLLAASQPSIAVRSQSTPAESAPATQSRP